MAITATKIKTWDAATRLWHWLVVALIVFLWYSGDIADDLMQWHLLAGRALLALLLFRLVWGFVGSETARFNRFLRAPGAAISEVTGLLSGRHRRYLGHNPAGGWFVMILLTLMSVQAISGLFVSDGYLWEGPWAGAVSSDTQDVMMDVHEWGIKLLQAAVAVHLCAIVAHSLRGDHLVGAMFSGRKKAEPSAVDPIPSLWRSPWLALVLLALCSGLVLVTT